jgi:hypothetical protein
MVFTLLKNLTFAGQQGDLRFANWVAFPAGYENAQFVVVVKSRTRVSKIDLYLQTSWDTDSVWGIATTFMSTGGPGTTIVNITSGLGPLVRLSLPASRPSAAQVSSSAST